MRNSPEKPIGTGLQLNDADYRFLSTDTTRKSPQFRKGRGAVSNEAGRFESVTSVPFYDDWQAELPTSKIPTQISIDHAKTIISNNQSPDIPFDQSINPYRGCEHGCVYCFARPTHSYLGLSPGLDFETRLFKKPDAAILLEQELKRKQYQVKTIALGVNTDAYQPIEKETKITRELLEVLHQCKHPVSIITKSALIERDIDILSDMAKDNLCSVIVSLTTLDKHLCRIMEPRAAASQRRLTTIKRLSDAGIPTGILFAPAIPFINDHEMESILSAATEHGAQSAGYIVLRLPHELTDIWSDWLKEHYPDRAQRVMKIVKLMRGGKEYQATFGERMTGTGDFAQLLNARFKLALRKHKLQHRSDTLNTSLFTAPGAQMDLFSNTHE